MSSDPRFFFDQDGCCLWRLIPEARRQEWNAWLELDGDDPASWEAPAYARLLDDRLSEMTFSLPSKRPAATAGSSVM